MVKEAEANREADSKRKEEADLKNEAEQLIFMTEKSIKDLGDKVDEKDKKDAEEKMEDLKPFDIENYIYGLFKDMIDDGE